MTIFAGIEGTTEMLMIGVIEAPKPSYTVKYMDEDDTVIFERTVLEGENAEAPEAVETNEQPAAGNAETAAPEASAEELIPESVPQTDEPTVKTRIYRDVSEAIGAQAFTKDTLSLKVEKMRMQEAREKEERVLAHQKKLDDMARARDAYFNGFGPENSSSRRSQRKVTSDTSTYDYDTFAAARDSDNKETSAEETQIQGPLFGELRDDDEPKKRHGFLKFLLTILILAGLVEGAIFGINRFAPDTRASEIATDVQSVIEEGAEFVGDKSVELFNMVRERIFGTGKTSSSPQPEEHVITSRGVDLTAVLAKANKNIQEVTENTSLSCAEGVKYTIDGLEKMEVVTDPELIGELYSTLIAYNSAWVDYVSGDSDKCLEYLKEGSAAYNSAVNYEGRGQVTETFDGLQLGEVRKNGDTYYLFSKEAIRIKNGSGENKMTYYWIYKLENVDGSFKISDYSEY